MQKSKTKKEQIALFLFDLVDLKAIFVSDNIIFKHEIIKENGKADEVVNGVQEGMLGVV